MFLKLAACLAILWAPALADDAKPNLPDGPGKETTVKVCGKCHGMDVTVSRRETADGWNAIVLQMIKRGAKGTDDQFGVIVDYLADHFPKSEALPRIAINTASAKDLESSLGVTEKEAAAIVQYREDKGKFKSFDDLLKVPGVDASKLEPKKSRIDF
jgi:competence protein ComEA